jgi:Sugar efflux transporter for intercellular exchange
MSTNFGFHHLRKRHRARQTPLATARSWALVRLTDYMVYAASGLSILFTTDQARIVWIDHNVSGISLPAWGCYLVSSSVWIFYGWVHKDRTILIMNTLWVFMYVLIVVGAIIY